MPLTNTTHTHTDNTKKNHTHCAREPHALYAAAPFGLIVACPDFHFTAARLFVRFVRRNNSKPSSNRLIVCERYNGAYNVFGTFNASIDSITPLTNQPTSRARSESVIMDGRFGSVRERDPSIGVKVGIDVRDVRRATPRARSEWKYQHTQTHTHNNKQNTKTIIGLCNTAGGRAFGARKRARTQTKARCAAAAHNGRIMVPTLAE